MSERKEKFLQFILKSIFLFALIYELRTVFIPRSRYILLVFNFPMEESVDSATMQEINEEYRTKYTVVGIVRWK